MKQRKPRGVVMWASRAESNRFYAERRIGLSFAQPIKEHGYFYANPSSITFVDMGRWPGPKLEPGECRKVRVVIEEVE